MLVRLLLNLVFFLPLLPFRVLLRAIPRRRFFARLRLGGALPMAARPKRPFDPRPEPPTQLGLLSALDALDRRRDSEGLVVEIEPVAFGWATALALRARLAALGAGGKRVIAFLPNGGGTKELFIASGAREVYLAPEAPLWALGLRVEATYLGEAFERIGLEAQVEATGPHKSAGDRFTRRTMSDADRAQKDRILDVTYERVVSEIAKARRRSEADVRAFFDSGPQGGADAVATGLVDGVLHEDEIHAKLGPPPGPRVIPLEAALRRLPLLLPLRRPPCIAVIPLSGTIVPAGVVPPWMARPNITSALRRAARDRSVRGVVLAIDSPGGSATTSEAIHREVIRLREKKPVVAVLGDVAASGGYYVAVAAERLVTSAVTLTGSIGVVGGKVVVGGALERLGVHREALSRGARAGLLSTSHAWNEEERKAFRAELERMYATFLGRVAEGRKQSRDAIEPLAGGRVWIGVDALANGLADVEGDLASAIAWMRDRIGRPKLRAVAYAGSVSTPPPLPLAALVIAREHAALLGPFDLEIAG